MQTLREKQVTDIIPYIDGGYRQAEAEASGNSLFASEVKVERQ
jgi:hypothetical protein